MIKLIADMFVFNACCVGEIGLHALDVDTKTWEHFEGRGRGKGRPHRTHAAPETPAPPVKSSRRSEEFLGGRSMSHDGHMVHHWHNCRLQPTLHDK